MYTFITGGDVTLDVIAQMVEMNKLVYEPVHLSPIEQIQTWVAKNPDIYIVAIHNPTNKVVGYMNLMPLRTRTLIALMNDSLVDGSILQDDLLEYKSGREYDAYLCSVVIHPQFRNPELTLRLERALQAHIASLERRGIRIASIFAKAVTPEGRRLAEHMGYTPLNQTTTCTTYAFTFPIPEPTCHHQGVP